MNRFDQYLNKKESDYVELVSSLEKRAKKGIDLSDEEVNRLDSYSKNIRIARDLSEKHEFNKKISDTELRIINSEIEIIREDEVYNQLLKSIFDSCSLPREESDYVIERLFEFRAKIEERTMGRDLYMAISTSAPKDIINVLLSQYSKNKIA